MLGHDGDYSADDGEYSAEHSKAKFWRLSVKNGKISAVKHFIEKPILLNFVNVSRNPWQ